jgi:leucyl aminopeptidase
MLHGTSTLLVRLTRRAGVPSVFTFEAKFENHSPFIHTSDDTVAHISFDHMKSFVNNVIGFAVEMSLFRPETGL